MSDGDREKEGEDGVIMNNEAEAERISREMAEERTQNGLPGTASS